MKHKKKTFNAEIEYDIMKERREREKDRERDTHTKTYRATVALRKEISEISERKNVCVCV